MDYNCKISKVKPLEKDRSKPVKTVSYLDINLDEGIVKIISDRCKKLGILLKRKPMMVNDMSYPVLCIEGISLQGTF